MTTREILEQLERERLDASINGRIHTAVLLRFHVSSPNENLERKLGILEALDAARKDGLL